MPGVNILAIEEHDTGVGRNTGQWGGPHFKVILHVVSFNA